MVLHEELPGPYRQPPGRSPAIGTLPFDDSIPSRSELRSRGFFKTLEKAAVAVAGQGNHSGFEGSINVLFPLVG